MSDDFNGNELFVRRLVHDLESLEPLDLSESEVLAKVLFGEAYTIQASVFRAFTFMDCIIFTTEPLILPTEGKEE